MSTGLECFIEERKDGWWFGIEDPNNHRLADIEFIEEGPFPTIAAMLQAYRRHTNPGGFSLDLLTTSEAEFEREWNRR